MTFIFKNVFFIIHSSTEDFRRQSQGTPERNPSSSSNSEVFTTPQALPSSPVITITPENGFTANYVSPQNSPGGTPKVVKRDTFKQVKRNDSLSRQKSFSKKYELSPELQDQSVRFLERKYGGKLKAHHAALVIQSYYRKYRMDKQFRRMRTYSITPSKGPFRNKSNSDPSSQVTSPRVVSPGQSQVTPVLRIKKRPSGSQRVKSILIIDNINSLNIGEPQRLYSSESSPSFVEEKFPTDLTSIFVGASTQVEDKQQEQRDVRDEKVETRLGSVTSVTEHYVKVEVLDNVEVLPDDAFAENGEASKKVPNGDLPMRQRRGTFNDDGSICESDDESGLENVLYQLMYFDLFLLRLLKRPSPTRVLLKTTLTWMITIYKLMYSLELISC